MPRPRVADGRSIKRQKFPLWHFAQERGILLHALLRLTIPVGAVDGHPYVASLTQYSITARSACLTDEGPRCHIRLSHAHWCPHEATLWACLAVRTLTACCACMIWTISRVALSHTRSLLSLPEQGERSSATRVSWHVSIRLVCPSPRMATYTGAPQ